MHKQTRHNEARFLLHTILKQKYAFLTLELLLRPSSYVAFLPCRIQFNKLNSAEIRRLNRLPHFCRTFDWPCRIIRQKCDTDSNVAFLPCRIQFIHYVNVLSMRRLRLAIQDGVTEGRVRFRRKLLLFV